LYVTSKYVDNVQNKIQYSEFVANQLKVPSYLSLEYVLQKYSVLTESVFAYTSITLKSKRIYKNNLGSFIYRSIKPDLFTGFNLNRISEYTIYEATKEKALFDYLYLKFFRKKKIEKSMLDVLRLNTDGFNEEEKRKFNEYCNMVGIKKYNNLPNILF
jgi:L-rhamnose mutarotase